MSRRSALLAVGLGCVLLGLLAVGWRAGWWQAGDPAGGPAVASSRAESPLPSALADQALPLLLARLEACAEAQTAPACRGLPLLSFRLRAEAGVVALGELQVRSGELSGELLACLGRAVGDIRLASPGARGELSVELPLGCGPDGRVRPLPVHVGRTRPAAATGPR